MILSQCVEQCYKHNCKQKVVQKFLAQNLIGRGFGRPVHPSKDGSERDIRYGAVTWMRLVDFRVDSIQVM
jgi:hypothetical protein